MSQHSRNERNANAALVVPVDEQDLAAYAAWPGDPLAGLAFQRALEHKPPGWFVTQPISLPWWLKRS